MLKAIYLEWEDATGTEGWTDKRDIERDMIVKSVGWYVDETDEAVVISTSYDAPDSWESPLVIPKSSIRRRMFVETFPE